MLEYVRKIRTYKRRNHKRNGKSRNRYCFDWYNSVNEIKKEEYKVYSNEESETLIGEIAGGLLRLF